MRILFTIPHFFNAQGGGAYGSLKADPRPRLNALATTIFALHSTVGSKQGLLLAPPVQSNTVHRADIDVVVCTAGEQHLVGQMKLPSGMFRHHPTDAKPMFLGFECHAVLRDALGKYDYYCFLEDDLQISDPLFFDKQQWFNGLFGDKAVLQPNRFEVAVGMNWHKLYIDGDLRDRSISERLQDVNDQPELTADAFGKPVKFQRVNNPHSGCFFLNSRQMEYWSKRLEFLNRDPSFAGPLESAATLGIMLFFRAYKPARENTGFLEIRHLDNRYLGTRSRTVPQPMEKAQAQ